MKQILLIFFLLLGIANVYCCEKDLDCLNDGVCDITITTNSTTGVCVCEKENFGPKCEGTKKSQLVAFLLSFFLGGIGVDRFYLGYILMGVFKFFLPIFPFFLSPLACCFKKEYVIAIVAVASTLCGLALVAWWLADLILIATYAIQVAGDGITPVLQNM
jgi:TM2 domain-containing membrane protein YozV